MTAMIMTRQTTRAKALVIRGDQSEFTSARLKALLAAAALAMGLLAAPHAGHAQGIVRGAQEGAYEGNRAAGPVGGVVGGAIGAGVGGAVGAVNGVLGVPNRPYYRSRYHRGCRGTYRHGRYHCYR
jgi:hypothetical protein